MTHVPFQGFQARPYYGPCIPPNVRKLHIFNDVEARSTIFDRIRQMTPKIFREGNDKIPANILLSFKYSLHLNASRHPYYRTRARHYCVPSTHINHLSHLVCEYVVVVVFKLIEVCYFDRKTDGKLQMNIFSDNQPVPSSVMPVNR